MKKLIIIALIFLFKASYGQYKDCKTETVPNPLDIRSNITGIVIKTSEGKAIITKDVTTIHVFYKTSAFSAILTANTGDVSLDVDSAKLLIDYKTKYKLPVYGHGVAINRNALKPFLRNPTVDLELNPTAVSKLENVSRIVIALYAAKDAEGSVFFTEKETNKIKQAIQCLLTSNQ